MLADIKYFHTQKQVSGKQVSCLASTWTLSGDHPFSMYARKTDREVIETAYAPVREGKEDFCLITVRK